MATGSETAHRKPQIDISRRSLLKLPLLALVPFGTRISGFAMHSPIDERIRFGLNYVPRKNWWYAWQDWDARSIADDFQAIASLGMDHIRIQCLWPVFQPGVSYISPAALGRLGELLDLAERSKLDVEVTVLDGWLSGYSFLPAWVGPLNDGKNIFTNADIIKAEESLFKTIAEGIGRHDRFLGFDVGNEINVLEEAGGNPANMEESDRWAMRMLDFVAKLAPGKFHVNGADDGPWFSDAGFSRQNLARTGSATVLHCYAYFTGALKRYRYDDAGNLHLLEYMVELAKAYETSPSRQVWVEEVGASPEWMPEQYIPTYADALIRNAASCGHIWGFTWWCSHDIDPSIKGFDSLEYTLGVLDQKNRVKPIGRMLARLAREMQSHPVREFERSTALVIPDGRFPGTGESPGWTVGKQFMELVAQGVRPAIILESRAGDEPYLEARGIRDMVKLKV
jgi:endo-1,4-beta-mannosidase